MQFPVPYLDFYMMYTIDNKEHFNSVRSLVEDYILEESLTAMIF